MLKQYEYTRCLSKNGEMLLCPLLRFSRTVLALLLGYVMLSHPQAKSTDQDGPRSSKDLIMKLGL